VKAAACVAAALLAATSASAEAKLHVVKAGESLASIAEAELGDRALWSLLYKANRDQIKDPTRIYPGQQLTIPDPSQVSHDAPPEPDREADG
jgi:nucleoid-associated protein YgaU